ncbi:MAG: glycosyltransferase family 4 protein [Crocosphaera sp.]|nr:glycosyltransferase family 4 protein [Crocosphaera sp.]
MILYIAKDLTGLTGGPQAGKDILISLLASEFPITVISQSKQNSFLLPQEKNGKCLNIPDWLLFSKEKAIIKPPQRKSQIPNYLIDLLQNKLNQLFNSVQKNKLRQLDQQLIIVNGLGNHLFWENINPEVTHKKALIIHESPRHFQKPSYLSLDYAIEAFQNYSYFIFVSSRCRDEWADIASLDQEKLLYIPNCCQEDLIKQVREKQMSTLRQELGFPQDQLVAVCVASLQPRKGQDILIDVFPEILDILPNLKLYLIGPTGYTAKWSKSLLKKIASSGWGDHVEYLGPKDNCLDFIYGADVLVLPSRAEAMPKVILEAMALGTPVIASDVDGVRELIQDGQSGFLFSPDNPSTLVSAFQAWKNELNNIDCIIENAEEKYWESFSKEQQIQRYKQAVSYMLAN